MILLVAPESYSEMMLFPGQGYGEGAAVTWSAAPVSKEPVSACIDLLFDNTPERTAQLKNTLSEVIFVNLVEENGTHLPDNFIRINGWPGFWQRNVAECATKNGSLKKQAQEILSKLGKTIEWTPDIPGFISARIISGIINEAYFSLGEGISTKEEIDLAMKMGTNYPLGPFEWGKQIGLQNVLHLLNKMAEANGRYLPAPLLKQEAQLS